MSKTSFSCVCSGIAFFGELNTLCRSDSSWTKIGALGPALLCVRTAFLGTNTSTSSLSPLIATSGRPSSTKSETFAFPAGGTGSARADLAARIVCFFIIGTSLSFSPWPATPSVSSMPKSAQCQYQCNENGSLVKKQQARYNAHFATY